jgi:hypothetical protein
MHLVANNDLTSPHSDRLLDWVKMRSDPVDGPFFERQYSIQNFDKSAAGRFINLNQYLIANGLRTAGSEGSDPRRYASSYYPWHAEPTPDGVKKILTVGAPQ